MNVYACICKVSFQKKTIMYKYNINIYVERERITQRKKEQKNKRKTKRKDKTEKGRKEKKESKQKGPATNQIWLVVSTHLKKNKSNCIISPRFVKIKQYLKSPPSLFHLWITYLHKDVSKLKNHLCPDSGDWFSCSTTYSLPSAFEKTVTVTNSSLWVLPYTGIAELFLPLLLALHGIFFLRC